MLKIKSFKTRISETNLETVEKQVNDFIKNHDTRDIKISTYQHDSGYPMIIYIVVYWEEE